MNQKSEKTMKNEKPAKSAFVQKKEQQQKNPCVCNFAPKCSEKSVPAIIWYRGPLGLILDFMKKALDPEMKSTDAI